MVKISVWKESPVSAEQSLQCYGLYSSTKELYRSNKMAVMVLTDSGEEEMTRSSRLWEIR